MEECTVDRPLRVDRVEDHSRDRFERLVGDGAGRVGVRGNRMNQRPAELVGRLKGGTKRRSRATKRNRDLVLEMEIAAAEHRHVRRHTAEGIGLVHKTGGQNAWHGLPLRKVFGVRPVIPTPYSEATFSATGGTRRQRPRRLIPGSRVSAISESIVTCIAAASALTIRSIAGATCCCHGVEI